MQARFWKRSREKTAGAAQQLAAGSAIDMAEFAFLAAAMSRLISQLTALPAFKSSKVGLTEWVALTVINGKGGIGVKTLAKSLGISGKRAAETTASLSAAGLIKLSQGDKQQTAAEITGAGKAKLAEVNGAIRPLLGSILKGKERSIMSASKTIRLLTRIGQPAQGPKSA